SAAVEALTARLAAAHAGAAPAADPVSLQSAVGFSALGSEHAAIAGEGVEELGRSGVAVGESGIGYAAGDAVAAATYLVSGGSL
ncbi:PE domain-containing protein, partial [Mycobacterium tuberculosis]